MPINLDQVLNTGSLLLTLYVIAAVLLYVVFIKKSSKPKRA
ncbi:MAG: hypothetical protein Q8L37_02660 [Candidatus Gottesmanbacteria bacterium]|nr:hypothetical protein [Candidatus Gottesmanbacteria bacterium]